MAIKLIENGNPVNIILDSHAYEGVKRIAKVVASDMELVCGKKPNVTEAVGTFINTDDSDCSVIIAGSADNADESMFSFLEQHTSLNIDALRGRSEVFELMEVKYPFGAESKVQKALVVAGSDKRGTIYGLFKVSELIGVSPLVFWGDVTPAKRTEVQVDFSVPFISKEPSVKYRGFFINDEWPAFGRWCNEKYGGFTAECYEQVFLLLLRLKGNYMWPAMWSSAFSEDGPGIASAELANIYGVIMGASHHEPMCRAGVEWQNIYKNYGEDNTWSFISNRDAITEFWKDGIKRNKNFENIITIGMRGENDSMLLGANATLKDNIDIIKQAILTQHKLIRENINCDLKKVVRMLAIYKEVEDYYYGDENTEGLKNWYELKDVILMLCEDNFGNMRGLPAKEDLKHPGGYGMYYHFDYHGAPISYEWQNCTKLIKTWEQMTLAYEYGVKKLWIVNVGDLKGNEYPLSYFMELAYDYDYWSKPGRVKEFRDRSILNWYGDRISDYAKEKIGEFVDGFTALNALRHPETMNPHIYNPVNYLEADRVYSLCEKLTETAGEIKKSIPKDCFDSFASMFYYAGLISLNNVMMNIDAGRNSFYASHNCIIANKYAEQVEKAIERDMGLTEEFHSLLNGKWDHMMDSAHTGFKSWDDHDWSYPVTNRVVPIHRPKVCFGFKDEEIRFNGEHWQYPKPLLCRSFERADVKEAYFEMDMRGDTGYEFSVEIDREWLSVSELSGKISTDEYGHKELIFRIDRDRLTKNDKAQVTINLKYDAAYNNSEKCRLVFNATDLKCNENSSVFAETQDMICIKAAHFSAKKDTSLNNGKTGSFLVLEGLGRLSDAVKAFPANTDFRKEPDRPYVQYDFIAAKSRKYRLKLAVITANPVIKGDTRECLFSINDGEQRVLTITDKDYFTEWRCKKWAEGVLNSVQYAETEIELNEGHNTLKLFAYDTNVVIETIMMYPYNTMIKESYLGPIESMRT